MPTSNHQRLRACLKAGSTAYRPGWEIHFITTGHGNPQIAARAVHAALAKAATSTDSHVIGLSTQDGQVRRDVARQIKPYFRFAWINNALLAHFPHRVPEFVAGLNLLLEQEETWASLVRPTHTDSPLLLPACSFVTAHDTLWSRVEEFGDLLMIRAAARAVDAFRADHWRPTTAGPRRWVDDGFLIFDHSGPRHGTAPFPRSWKYSFRIPDGFHYDVSSARSREFGFSDASDVRRLV